jgi:hypothetical protein
VPGAQAQFVTALTSTSSDFSTIMSARNPTSSRTQQNNSQDNSVATSSPDFGFGDEHTL